MVKEPACGHAQLASGTGRIRSQALGPRAHTARGRVPARVGGGGGPHGFSLYAAQGTGSEAKRVAHAHTAGIEHTLAHRKCSKMNA